METWLLCWNCEHDTLQERKHYDKFYRTQEIFSKELSGSVKMKYYGPLLSSHAFYKCKKCGAPNYYVHEYWPSEKESGSSTQEAIEFHNSIDNSGKWDKDKLFHIYHFPIFHKNPV